MSSGPCIASCRRPQRATHPADGGLSSAGISVHVNASPRAARLFGAPSPTSHSRPSTVPTQPGRSSTGSAVGDACSSSPSVVPRRTPRPGGRRAVHTPRLRARRPDAAGRRTPPASAPPRTPRRWTAPIPLPCSPRCGGPCTTPAPSMRPRHPGPPASRRRGRAHLRPAGSGAQRARGGDGDGPPQPPCRRPGRPRHRWKLRFRGREESRARNGGEGSTIRTGATASRGRRPRSGSAP